MLRRLLNVMLTSCLLAPSARAEAPPAWDPAVTWVLVAGVLRWEDPALEPFTAKNRKDIELMEVLAARGVPARQRSLLIDRGATSQRIVAALAAQVEAAPPGATFIVYFEGHGLVDERGRYVLATAETHTDHLDRTGLGVAALLPILARRGARDRVLLLADACFSGHLAALAAAASWLGVPTVALTSASEVSLSSENWTYTQALIDALRGRPFVDRDGDGVIRLSEVAEETRAAMRFREGQPIGWAPMGFADLTLAVTAPWPADLAALDPRGEVFARGDWVVARRLDGERGIARVLGARREEGRPLRLRLEHYDYSDRAFGWARESEADPVMFYSYPIGALLRVDHDGIGYAARVVRVDDGMHLMKFVEALPGQGDVADQALPRPQFVTPDQIRGHLDPAFDARERVLVEDDGDLYEALVKGRFHGEVCVRYPGSPFVEDDCVPEARVSPDTRAP